MIRDGDDFTVCIPEDGVPPPGEWRRQIFPPWVSSCGERPPAQTSETRIWLIVTLTLIIMGNLIKTGVNLSSLSYSSLFLVLAVIVFLAYGVFWVKKRSRGSYRQIFSTRGDVEMESIL